MNKKQLIVAWVTKFLCLLIFVLPLCGCCSIPQNKHPIDKTLGECMDNSKCITLKMNDCLAEAYKKWEAEIDKYYKLLMDTLPGGAGITLEKSQSAWMNFRDLESGAIPDIYIGIIGSFRGPTFLEHKMDILKARAEELKAYYDNTKDEERILK